MERDIEIYVDDPDTATQVDELLISAGLRPTRGQRAESPKFGATFARSAKGISIKISAAELLALVSAAPQVVESLFSTLRILRDQGKIFAKGNRLEIPVPPGKVIRKTHQEWGKK